MIKTDLAYALQAVTNLLRRHPKRITGSLAALLLGTGVTAFGVAPLAPDAADLPVRQVLEAVQSLPTEAQTEALDNFQFKLFRSETTRSTDTADALLKRLNIDDAAAAAFLRSDANGRLTLMGRPGKNVTVEATDNNQLLKLTVRWATDDEEKFTRLVVERAADNRFTSRVETAAYTSSTQLASGTIQTSLFAATDNAGIPDAVAIQVAEIFSGDIDFHRALRKGDRFSVVYETLEADGEALRTGRVVSTEFVNNGKTLQAMWFRDQAGGASAAKGGYYTLDGQSLRRAYLASPMEFSRVSSGFKMRFHPILQTWRAHLGVDYAAPTGTAVRSIGDGVVEFAGVQNGFGNVVFIKHRNNHTTVYAHLSRINVQRGQSVSQGQNVGAVGATGWATGPHLHFEFRVNGAHQDPMTLAQQNETVPLSAAAQPLFRKLAGNVKQQLQAAADITQTRAE
ncbi:MULTISPECIES: M23 family metallopeptidase [unclassified Polaromonas]|uniref:M23 family metallopeptidase n=1 Tax=unclassified Polaromonas TaxID=2638319 RepID=UPI000BC94F9B|nr:MULTISPECIES: M23 family metallopeptidase [unclassified Polaromonas]OYY35786.1 MAG: peptidase M23 [Polaromonas sp. 35-63-35]OYZ19908.1 MAG: peptidase M23 [Polaromonas sp. 16-63-31]OYZ76152.1 MAG: peptidase M23 [Polaromonas sp. 24-63-21]OZA51941.1 MAG: peptidase M23 [Polaromonas sp. 17-63-33]OZA88026.1 MAG: peptidase M23 [Polaromonas sp. 39-63-25]